jgi:hypothetical protein
MPLVLAGATSGSTTIQPTDAATVTATFPPATGTVMVSGNMPAFSVSSTALVSAAASTFTKVTYDTEDFDTNSNFASSRFTPTVAGYYQFNTTISFSANLATGGGLITFYKNGARFLDGPFIILSASTTQFASCSGIIYLNGSTDYVEIYGYQTTASAMNIGSAASTVKFTGCLVRSA